VTLSLSYLYGCQHADRVKTHPNKADEFAGAQCLLMLTKALRATVLITVPGGEFVLGLKILPSCVVSCHC